MMTLTQSLAILLFAAAASMVAWASDPRTVSTSWGVVRGEVVSPGTDDLPPVAQYLGVPYGVAPTGQHRFNMAISAAKWTHQEKDARRVQPSCIQSDKIHPNPSALKFTSAERFDHMHRMYGRLTRAAEDCLYMNLFVPQRLVSSSSSPSPLPVLVLVHGDSFSWGGGGAFNGTTLAAAGQIIVVTLNYRLGPYGFLGRCESSSCSGNVAISDLVTALQMLSAILPAFGGSHREITLMGWGAGAAIVSLLMASPLTAPANRRLFARAILLDGTALAPWALSNDPQGVFLQLAEKLGCLPSRNGSSNPLNEGIESYARCMQDHSAANVTRAADAIDVPTFMNAFAPIIDGRFVVNKPSHLFSPSFGSLFREIDLLVGTVSQPAHHLLPNGDLHGMHREQREKILRTLIRNLYDFHRTEILAATLNEYTDWNQPKENGRAVRDSVLGALSDALFTSPLVETLRAHSSDETRREATTYFFHFGHETRGWSSRPERAAAGVHGAVSGDLLPYALGYPLSARAAGGAARDEQLYSEFSADDVGMSRVLMHYIASFVKHGDPTKQPMQRESQMEERFASIAWPQFSQPNREAYLDISRSDERKVSVRNFYRNAHVAFWSGLVPQLHVNGREGVAVPEEHHQLPGHFREDSFFGRVRPYGGHSNLPFPPPPLPPPTPPPSASDAKKAAAAAGSGGASSAPAAVSSAPPSMHAAAGSTYTTILLLVVVLGCGMIFVNICFACATYRKCNQTRRSKKKLQLQQQASSPHFTTTYASNHAHHQSELTYGLNSPMTSMPAPPPPLPGAFGKHNHQHHHHCSSGGDGGGSTRASLCVGGGGGEDSGAGAFFPNFAFVSSTPAHHLNGSRGSLSRTGGGGGSFSSQAGSTSAACPTEQEPLLSASQKTSIAGIRPGVSPTCPRHGRSAMAAAVAASRGNSSAPSGAPGSLERLPPPPMPLEEIQV